MGRHADVVAGRQAPNLFAARGIPEIDPPMQARRGNNLSVRRKRNGPGFSLMAEPQATNADRGAGRKPMAAVIDLARQRLRGWQLVFF
jgi:hypothetical protein